MFSAKGVRLNAVGGFKSRLTRLLLQACRAYREEKQIGPEMAVDNPIPPVAAVDEQTPPSVVDGSKTFGKTYKETDSVDRPAYKLRCQRMICGSRVRMVKRCSWMNSFI